MILDAPPKEWLKKRPRISVKAKFYAMLDRYGFAGLPWARWLSMSLTQRLADLFSRFGIHHFHHNPGLWERQFDTEKNDTVPAANDHHFIEALTPAEHDVIENGPGGEKRTTSAGSATNRRAKIKRANKPKKSPGPKLRDRGFYKNPNFKRTVGGKVVPRNKRRRR